MRIKGLTSLRSIVCVILFIWIAINFTSCNNDTVESTYAKYRAYFRYDNVMTTQPFYAALTGAGQYCSVYVQNKRLYFSSLTKSDTVSLTAVAYYESFISIDGFIAGLSNVPDMNTGTLPWVAYDRACPNCYENDGITHPLSLKENGFAYCTRCKRTYDLNNLGFLVSGDAGIKMYRYRIAYNGSNLVIIQNSAQ